jgi:uncharacterized protein YaeQ
MLFRFQIELSDIDRSIYETLDFRIAQHPSETPIYLLCRVLAYGLSYQDGIEFSASGLSDPDAPALLAAGKNGSTDLWIEIGNPSDRKLHKASKTARQVVVYTYKNPEPILNEIKSGSIHRGEEIQVYALDPKVLQTIATLLKKSNSWSIVRQTDQVTINIGEQSFSLSLELRT